jgi:D-alanine transaminase
MSIVYLNGDFIEAKEAKVSVLDRGFLFGDGVYEVIPVYNGQLFRLQQHLKRLQYSLSRIHLEFDWSLQQWQQMLEQLISQNEGENLALYLQVTRGFAEKRDHRFPANAVPTIYAMVNPLAPLLTEQEIQPCKAITVEDIRWKNCDIKSISLLGNVLLAQQAAESTADESILINDGIATEGSISNMFMVKNGQVFSSLKDNRILGGITRELVIELLQKNGITVSEKEITLAELKDADEIWLTSSTKEIRPVIELDGETVGAGVAGPLWNKAIKIYLEYKLKLYGDN